MKQIVTAFVVVLGVASVGTLWAQERQKPADEAARVADETVTIAANGSTTVTYDGKNFASLKLSVGNTQLKYRLARGSEILSSGHTTGVIEIKSDGTSKYSLKLANPTKSSVTTKIVASGGGSDI